MLRSICLIGYACACVFGVNAQLLQGSIADPVAAGRTIRIHQARGAGFIPFDSTEVAGNGTFKFKEPIRSAGFYQLALNDSDRVDLVMDTREQQVVLRFGTLPLAEQVHVETSLENRAFLSLRSATAQTAAIREAVRLNKANLAPSDTLALQALDRVQARADSSLQHLLDSLVRGASHSCLGRSIRTERALEGARRKGPMAVAKVFDFSSPELLHSALYDEAIMVFLQNINAVSEDQFLNASDTLMKLASGNSECRAYMLEHLINLFATYGPDRAVQHLVDRYVVAAPDSFRMTPELRVLVEDLMRVSVGRTAPDIGLNDHGTPLRLSDLVGKGRYTALFFYSSTCEHCHAQMPGLKDLREVYHSKGFDVIGIALDVDSAQFLASIRDNAIPWKCFSEFNGWGSSAAKAFQVKGTPMIFLLDAAMTIVAKPANAVELHRELEHWLP